MELNGSLESIFFQVCIELINAIDLLYKKMVDFRRDQQMLHSGGLYFTEVNVNI